MAAPSRFHDQSMTINNFKADQAVAEGPSVGQPFVLGSWKVDPRDGTIRSEGGTERLEPRVMTLLQALAARGTELVSKDTLLAEVWSDTVVGDDALARGLLKLRRALGDDAREPSYIETVPRRGYRLLQAPEAIPGERRASRLLLVWLGIAAAILVVALAIWLMPTLPTAPPAQALLERAHDYYYQFDQAGNESAAELYLRLIEVEPQLADAKAGMANVLVQRVIRWPPERPPVPIEQQNIKTAQADGRTTSPWALATLEQAEQLAREAVALSEDEPYAHKALGLVLALREDPEAELSFRRALGLDPEMWEAWHNLGELASNAGDIEGSVEHYSKAYEAMAKRYADDPQRIGRWQPELGARLGETQLSLGHTRAAIAWFRQVLEYAPFHPRATAGLAAALAQTGEVEEARELCAELAARIGPIDNCGALEATGQQN